MNRRRFIRNACSLVFVPSFISRKVRADDGWLDLIGGKANGLEAFKNPKGYWKPSDEVTLDPKDPRKLSWTESQANSGIWVNGPTGRTNNLVTQAKFGDLEVMLDFVVPKGSNSGIKLQGLYEIQIYDSFGVAPEKFNASGLGGVYPRGAELLPRYHHIDKGYPAMVNASKPPGEWQTMHIIFRAPKFDAAGKKSAPAQFEKVVINGQVAHEKLIVPTPTGHAYVLPEVARGPILLQGDHGPVAFRNVKVRPLAPTEVS